MPFRMLVLAALAASFPCFGVLPAAAADDQTPKETVWPTNAWPVSTPEAEGMDSAGLVRLIENVGSFKQDSLTIIRHGKIVADVYYAPFVAGISHDLRSVTKSIVGTLTAIELNKGDLDSVDHPVVDLFSDKQVQNVDDRKRTISVQNLLDMTSGIEWTERTYTPDETLAQMYESADRTAFVLDRPMAGAPGARFNYAGGNPYLLSALINRKSGQNALDFARKELFGPLGIKSAKWGEPDAQGVIDGEANLSLSPHDMARIGHLYLHDGQWDGKQLILPSWVARAKAGPVVATNGFHYGNLWWSLPEKGAYMARGRHSQLILVIPKLDVVVAMTGHLPDTEFYSPSGLINSITSAVKSDQPLPENAIARTLLANAIHQAAIEKPSATGATPEFAKVVSGKTYHFPDNKLHVKSFVLNFYESDSSWVITTYTDKGNGRFTGLFGTDGVYRKSPPAPYGINATKGRWTGEHTFVMERRILGHSETQTWELTFDGDKVAVNFENTDGFKAELHGESTE
jgi:CubicO group peptidase (beta-lactamase class C family)